MKTEQANSGPAKEQGELPRANQKNATPGKSDDNMSGKEELDGKSDSGPEPDVTGQEIRPQK